MECRWKCFVCRWSCRVEHSHQSPLHDKQTHTYFLDFGTANITFRTLRSSQPAYLRSSLHACHSTRSLRLSNTSLLSAPFVHTSFGSRSFSVAAPKIWNSLPLSLRTCMYDCFMWRETTLVFTIRLENATDHSSWTKLTKDVWWSGWVWVGECFFWYRPTRVVPDKQLLNGCVCVCVYVC